MNNTYTRPYSNTDEIVIPESYGGTSLMHTPLENEDDKQVSEDTPNENPWEKGESVHTASSPKNDNFAETFLNFSKFPFLKNFGKILKFDNISLQKIGTEEILIIATAAFLLFSKQGDKECALMLLLLLFLG